VEVDKLLRTRKTGLAMKGFQTRFLTYLWHGSSLLQALSRGY